MHATRLRVLAWGHRRWRQLVVTAVLIGIAAGLAIGLAAGTRRTSSAPDRYTAAVGGDPGLVVTQQSGRPLSDQVAALPGVARTRSIAFVTSFLLSPVDGTPVLDPNPFAGDDQIVGARIVTGRFVDPNAPEEFTINRSFAALLQQRFGTKVGDTFRVSAYDQQQVDTNAFDSGAPPAVPPFTVRLVGIYETPSDFDDPSPTMIFPHSFLAAHPTVGVAQTIIATTLQPGVDASTVLDEIRALPNGADAYPVTTRVVSADARRAVRFQVTALWLVVAIAALAAAVVVLQIVGRMLRVSGDERTTLTALGWRRRDILTERALEAAAATIIAAPVAALLAYGLTSLFPLGVLRTFEPDPGLRMDWTATLYGLLALAVIAVLAASLVGVRRPTIQRAPARTGRLTGLATTGGASMPLTTAAGMLTSGRHGGRRSLASLLPGAIAVAGIVGAIVVGLSVTHIVDRPARWGVNFDQLFGNPYIPTDKDIVSPVVDNADVVAVTGATIGSLTLDGHDTPTFAVDAVKGDLLPTTLKGRPPADEYEIDIGAEVARRLGVEVGDEIDAVGSTGQVRRVRIVGIAITPQDAGDGAVVTFAGYASLNPGATENIVLVDFRPDAPASVAQTIQTIQKENFSPPGALTKPTSVRALQRVTTAPFLLAIILTVLLIAAGGYLLTTSVRASRRDLAVLRALGSDRRQLRAVVHWHASLVAVFVGVIGIPTGLILGRWVVRLITDALGIVPGADAPTLILLGVAAAVLTATNVIAVWPARRAARVRLALLTRDA